MSDSNRETRWILLGVLLGGAAVAGTIVLAGSWETVVRSAGTSVMVDLELRSQVLRP